MRPVVVKVGGSLFDLPDLAVRLTAFLGSFTTRVLVVPGGGKTADAIREFDCIHQLGDEPAHWLALRACTVNGHFLAHVLGGVPVIADVAACVKIAIIDLFGFAVDDERRPDRWPHRWDVTSDSMALRVAHVAHASELTLLKSSELPVGDDWTAAAASGGVDPFFSTALKLAPGVAVRAVHFRTCSRVAL
jgi:aspartokinase-like uncharacterized kinase